MLLAGAAAVGVAIAGGGVVAVAAVTAATAFTSTWNSFVKVRQYQAGIISGREAAGNIILNTIGAGLGVAGLGATRAAVASPVRNSVAAGLSKAANVVSGLFSWGSSVAQSVMP